MRSGRAPASPFTAVGRLESTNVSRRSPTANDGDDFSAGFATVVVGAAFEPWLEHAAGTTTATSAASTTPSRAPRSRTLGI